MLSRKICELNKFMYIATLYSNYLKELPIENIYSKLITSSI